MNNRSLKRRENNLKFINRIRTDMQNGYFDETEFSPSVFPILTEEDYETGNQLIAKYSKSLEQRYERFLHG